MPRASLRETLASGPLPPRSALRLADGLLAALEAVHAHGLVHRDVKPANIFLIEDAPVLADFGTAARPGPIAPEEADGWAGTPGYMAPELLTGEEATAGSDVYAAAAILFESLSGERWSALVVPDDANWTEIPSHVRDPLRKALARAPDARFGSASELRAALDDASSAPGATRSRGGLLAFGAVAVAAITLAVYSFGTRPAQRAPDVIRGPLPMSDLAILPCEATREEDRERARDISRMIARRLGGFPRIQLAPVQQVFRWADAASEAGELDAQDAPFGTRSRRVVACEMERVAADSVRIALRVWEGEPRPDEVYSTAHVGQIDRATAVADSLALDLLGFLLPDHPQSPFAPLPMSTNVEANEYLARGYDAFLRHALSDASHFFEEALARDPDFAAARWGLADVLRWAALSHPGEENLRELFAERSGDLGWRDSLLVMATIAPHGPGAFALYEAAIDRLPNDGYALLLYGDELFHRGSLWGVRLDSAEAVLLRAVATDPLLAPAWDHLAQIQIRLGEANQARSTLERLEATSAPPARGDVDFLAVWTQAFIERFEPARAAETRVGMYVTPNGSLDVQFLAFGARLIRYVDLPETQLAMALALIEGAPGGSTERLSGFNAAGLALTSLGRQAEGIAAFDSAAVAGDDPGGELHAAEWRVIPHALSIAGYGTVPAERGRQYLESVADDASAPADLRARAAWALALAALGDRSDRSAEAWTELLSGLEDEDGDRPLTGRLLTHLEGERLAAEGRYEEALEATLGLTAIDSAGNLLRPFGRAVLYVRRGQWQASSDQPGAAALSWLWHENTDLEGVPGERVQAGEVDGALGTHARLWIARAAAETGDRGRACRNAVEIARLWQAADAELRPLFTEAAGIASTSCTP
jgi:tetratricopeptide (TPR) repeat protein